MSKFASDLETILSPVRDLYLARYFRRLAKWRKIGYQVIPEAKIRDAEGRILRDGVLNLPRRADFGLIGRAGPDYRDIAEICNMVFEPVEFALSPRTAIRVAPFCWKSFTVTFDANDDPERLELLRHWYLEGFQPQRLEEGPDAFGVLHSLTGPRYREGTWTVDIDMGSAPIATFTRLLEMLVVSGVADISIGVSPQQPSLAAI